MITSQASDTAGGQASSRMTALVDDQGPPTEFLDAAGSHEASHPRTDN